MKKETKKPRIKNNTMAVALAAAGVSNVDKLLAHQDVQNLGIKTTIQEGALHAFDEFVKNKSNTVLSNPMSYIDDLSKYNPFWGSVALRVLCSTIGYNVVNTILWDYRKRNKAPEYKSGIDWLNDSIADIQAKEESEKSLESKGLETLHFLDGNTMIGAYKYLFMLVTGSGEDAGNMELPSPAVLFERMREKDKDRSLVLAEYETFQMERFKDSPNFEYVKARLERNKKANDTRAVRKAQDEIDHIHAELASVKHEVFDDGVWARIPLHMQFRIIKSVHNQVNSAIANEMEKPADERTYLEDLNALGEVLLLELQAADREAEVKLAFKRGILKPETHALIGSENAKVVA